MNSPANGRLAALTLKSDRLYQTLDSRSDSRTPSPNWHSAIGYAFIERHNFVIPLCDQHGRDTGLNRKLVGISPDNFAPLLPSILLKDVVPLFLHSNLTQFLGSALYTDLISPPPDCHLGPSSAEASRLLLSPPTRLIFGPRAREMCLDDATLLAKAETAGM